MTFVRLKADIEDTPNRWTGKLRAQHPPQRNGPKVFSHYGINMTESFAELFEQSQQAISKLKPGAIVTGIVVEIRNDVVVIDAGLKSEGIVPIEQFKNEEGVLEVQVGDEVKVALEALEDGFGETKLSREKAKRSMVWDDLEQAFDKEETIVGMISGKVKGGLTVDDQRHVRAFLPGSLVDVRPGASDADPPTKGKDPRSSRSSSWTASATTWCCQPPRRASRPSMGEEREKLLGAPARKAPSSRAW
ncbi:hypothetical protein RLIN73S_04299 [Rhodanobacter lindaniclasticus]